MAKPGDSDSGSGSDDFLDREEVEEKAVTVADADRNNNNNNNNDDDDDSADDITNLSTLIFFFSFFCLFDGFKFCLTTTTKRFSLSVFLSFNRSFVRLFLPSTLLHCFLVRLCVCVYLLLNFQTVFEDCNDD